MKIYVIVLITTISVCINSCQDSPPLNPVPFTFEFNTSQINFPGLWAVTNKTIKGKDGYPVLIICLSKNNFVVLSKKCGDPCEAIDPINNIITCPCDGTQYNLNGTVKKGNGIFPLKLYNSIYNSDLQKLIITLD